MTTVGRLVVCPTPIGNLEDVTLRVLAALRDADVVACEDTRRTRVLLERYGAQATLVSYHEHNERERADRKSTRLNSSHANTSYAVFWLKKKIMPTTMSSASCSSSPRGLRAANPPSPRTIDPTSHRN